jgi:hypothetical protein
MRRSFVRKAAKGAVPFVTALLVLASGVGVASAALPLPNVPVLPEPFGVAQNLSEGRY